MIPMHLRIGSRLLLCLALVAALAAAAIASRVASAGAPRFSVEVPNGWKAEPKKNETNQQISLQSSTRMMVIIAVEVNGDPAASEAQALEWIRKNKFPKATILTPAHAATFGSHKGHETTFKDTSQSGDYAGWAGTFFEGKVVFVCVGLSPLDDLAAASGDYRAVVATVQTGAATASTQQPEVSKPRWRDKIKNVIKAFAHILAKIPVFNPNPGKGK